MHPRGVGRSLLIATLAVAAGCQSAPAAPPFNVLLVSIDTVRGDFLGCYGHRPRRAPDLSPSPRLDAFAAEGVRMEQAYASSSWTLPSHVSMLTGQTPLVHGIDTDEQAFAGPDPTLGEILQRHGYRTAGEYSGPYLDPIWGFQRGFESYRPSYGAAATRANERFAALGPEIARAKASGDAEAEARLVREEAFLKRKLEQLWLLDVSSAHVTTNALEDIRHLARQGAPWFVFAHYFDPHNDYLPPPPYKARFDPAYTGPLTGKHLLANPLVSVRKPDDEYEYVRRASDRDLDHLMALYEGEIAWTDEQVGRLLRGVDELGLGAKTLVVIVSDHGEEFFEHGALGHRHTLKEEVLRIPLLLRLPGVLPAGKAVRGPVSTADIVPTVLDVLGLPERDGWSGSRSFLPLIREREDPTQREVFSRLVRFKTGNAVMDSETSVPARQVTITEVFRRGAIKISRTRAWLQFAPTAPAVRAALETEAEKQFRTEHLSWLDVDRFPSEPDGQESSSFSNAAARAALAAFQAQYRRLVEFRHATSRAQVTPQVQSALRALGYVGAGADVQPLEVDLRLPIPGEDVLR